MLRAEVNARLFAAEVDRCVHRIASIPRGGAARSTGRSQTWRQVDALVASKRPAAYDEAVGLLVDLRDLAAREGRAPAFGTRVEALREQHARKPRLLDRLRKRVG